ncbi:MAG: NADH-quinone oxidoreductase subunit A [Chloroflexi bacterium]|nr:NADH-quinone oxidoreductase subunit A [Chloroflexota bacterium]
MANGYFADYGAVLIATLVGAALVLIAFAAAALLAPKARSTLKDLPYECGVPPQGEAWTQTNVRYYLFGILFLIFDIEAVFLFPWAVIFAGASATVFYAMLVFVVILLFGLFYAWRKGALQWK